MKPRIFKARSIQKALANIKEELGSDAMILSTRRVAKSPRDPYSKEMFEVEAASKDFKKKDGPRQMMESGSLNHEPEKEKISEFASHGLRSGNESILEELISIKDMISLVGFGSDMQNMVGDHAESISLFASLLRTGISEKRVRLMLQRAFFSMDREQFKSPGSNLSLKKYVVRELVKEIRTGDPFTAGGGSNTPHIAVFVGPTGVGKTTTIAKLAAELSIKRQKRIGLISIDNYRIGAFEQLKAYASIMGLLCIAAFNRDDFILALSRMQEMDIVLIDTAGHSHSDTARMKEVADVINGDCNISVHLVLSVTTGFLDMREAASAFSRLNPETYIFTKVDETKRCGKIFDQLIDLRLPVSMVTNGQRVPEDLILPDTRELLGIILGAEHGGEK